MTDGQARAPRPRCRDALGASALERGDVVERLPDLLAERQLVLPTVVFATAVIGYLGKEGHDRIVAALEEAGRHPLAILGPSDRGADEHGHWGIWAGLLPMARASRARGLPRPVARVAGAPGVITLHRTRGFGFGRRARVPPSTRPLRVFS